VSAAKEKAHRNAAAAPGSRPSLVMDQAMKAAVVGARSELIWASNMLAKSTSPEVRAAAGLLLQRAAILQKDDECVVILSEGEMMNYAKRILRKIVPPLNQRTAGPGAASTPKT